MVIKSRKGLETSEGKNTRTNLGSNLLLSKWQCFDEVEKVLNDEVIAILLDYLESSLEDHFQVVHAIAIAIENNARDELKQLMEDLLFL